MSSPSASPKPFNIAIVGGGISGLTLAIALLEHNIPLTIYEGAHAFSEIGAGVAFGPNAARAMRLTHPRIAEAFEKCKTENLLESKQSTWFTVRVGDARKADKDGFVRPGKKVADALFDVKFSTDGHTQGGVYRAHFLDELVKSVPDHVAKFGKKLADISDATDGSGDKVLHFSDGTTAQHTAVIGCDGIKSVTRQIVLGKDDPAARAVFSGKYAYRGLIPMDEAVKLLGEEQAQNSQVYLGYHGHILTFPVEKGKTMNVVAFNSKDTWDDPNWVVHTTKEEMLADYQGWGPTVQSIIGAMQKPDIWSLFYHLPAATFHTDRICLLGDAAHATTPHHGAGAGMCIEDVLVLSSLLKEAHSVKDLTRAFSAYEEVRKSRSERNVKTSKIAGMLYDFEFLGDDLEEIEKNYTQRMGWIWNCNLEVEVERALAIFQAEKLNAAPGQ